ncbi:hypothetical protein BD324DRAFT_652750 [Kockovaella imperatae]|uniref:F-box domain-containing protein n=1 Tax=Kockovaella imperatae TaxID=4999 RepID=A0A1Y1UAF5_9TREE|nr:hypothetical protein BD324DRAFT_652750 [Kockovaella imperatae]ORX35031.1 hypothetical protein BD324DRAFT_652750 [Kockovaella imperatae]
MVSSSTNPAMDLATAMESHESPGADDPLECEQNPKSTVEMSRLLQLQRTTSAGDSRLLKKGSAESASLAAEDGHSSTGVEELKKALEKATAELAAKRAAEDALVAEQERQKRVEAKRKADREEYHKAGMAAWERRLDEERRAQERAMAILEEKKAIEAKKEREWDPLARKTVYARVPKWDDIPDWGDSTRCHLMELPNEILDLCFGFIEGETDLVTADYVALAGCSRFFRHCLDDDFFFEICHHSRMDLPQLPQPPVNAFYTPSGDRSTWTDAQVEVHDMERRQWQLTTLQNALNIRVCQLKRQFHRSTTTSSVLFRGTKALAIIDGRIAGQPSEDGKEEENIEAAATRLWAHATDPADNKKYAEEVLHTEIEQSAKRLWAKATDPNTRLMAIAKTLLDDPDADVEEQEYPFVVRYNQDGQALPHDYWPSKWRNRAAESVNAEWITKSDAMREFKVTEAELI